MAWQHLPTQCVQWLRMDVLLTGRPCYQAENLMQQGVMMLSSGVWLCQGKRLLLQSSSLRPALPPPWCSAICRTQKLSDSIIFPVSRWRTVQCTRGLGFLNLNPFFPLSIHLLPKPKAPLEEISDHFLIDFQAYVLLTAKDHWVQQTRAMVRVMFRKSHQETVGAPVLSRLLWMPAEHFTVSPVYFFFWAIYFFLLKYLSYTVF